MQSLALAGDGVSLSVWPCVYWRELPCSIWRSCSSVAPISAGRTLSTGPSWLWPPP